ncbi:uncharacterized protein [Prorops nasuta]|uniref:uncharacterized protein n=1 Tax=Prorops nasuta TaxID=863751 RepID=UPI0034CEB86A
MAEDYNKTIDSMLEIIGRLKKCFECVICLETVNHPVRTQCGHLFCRTCIKTVLQKRNAQCPLCGNHLTRRSFFDDQHIVKCTSMFQKLVTCVQEDSGIDVSTLSIRPRDTIESVSTTDYSAPHTIRSSSTKSIEFVMNAEENAGQHSSTVEKNEAKPCTSRSREVETQVIVETSASSNNSEKIAEKKSLDAIKSAPLSTIDEGEQKSPLKSPAGRSPQVNSHGKVEAWLRNIIGVPSPSKGVVNSGAAELGEGSSVKRQASTNSPSNALDEASGNPGTKLYYPGETKAASVENTSFKSTIENLVRVEATPSKAIPNAPDSSGNEAPQELLKHASISSIDSQSSQRKDGNICKFKKLGKIYRTRNRRAKVARFLYLGPLNVTDYHQDEDSDPRSVEINSPQQSPRIFRALFRRKPRHLQQSDSCDWKNDGLCNWESSPRRDSIVTGKMDDNEESSSRRRTVRLSIPRTSEADQCESTDSQIVTRKCDLKKSSQDCLVAPLETGSTKEIQDSLNTIPPSPFACETDLDTDKNRLKARLLKRNRLCDGLIEKQKTVSEVKAKDRVPISTVPNEQVVLNVQLMSPSLDSQLKDFGVPRKGSTKSGSSKSLGAVEVDEAGVPKSEVMEDPVSNSSVFPGVYGASARALLDEENAAEDIKPGEMDPVEKTSRKRRKWPLTDEINKIKRRSVCIDDSEDSDSSEECSLPTVIQRTRSNFGKLAVLHGEASATKPSDSTLEQRLTRTPTKQSQHCDESLPHPVKQTPKSTRMASGKSVRLASKRLSNFADVSGTMGEAESSNLSIGASPSPQKTLVERREQQSSKKLGSSSSVAKSDMSGGPSEVITKRKRTLRSESLTTTQLDPSLDRDSNNHSLIELKPSQGPAKKVKTLSLLTRNRANRNTAATSSAKKPVCSIIPGKGENLNLSVFSDANSVLSESPYKKTARTLQPSRRNSHRNSSIMHVQEAQSRVQPDKFHKSIMPDSSLIPNNRVTSLNESTEQKNVEGLRNEPAGKNNESSSPPQRERPCSTGSNKENNDLSVGIRQESQNNFADLEHPGSDDILASGGLVKSVNDKKLRDGENGAADDNEEYEALNRVSSPNVAANDHGVNKEAKAPDRVAEFTMELDSLMDITQEELRLKEFERDFFGYSDEADPNSAVEPSRASPRKQIADKENTIERSEVQAVQNVDDDYVECSQQIETVSVKSELDSGLTAEKTTIPITSSLSLEMIDSVAESREATNSLGPGASSMAVNVNSRNDDERLTHMRKSRNVKQRDLCFVCTGLTVSETDRMLEFARMFGAKFVTQFETEVTHVIVEIKGNGGAPKTLKYLQGVAYGRWIVGFPWVEACVRSQELVDEEPYEAVDCDTLGQGPRNSRLRSKNLFEDFAFYCIGPFMDITLLQYQNILRATGGTVVQSMDALAAQRSKLKAIVIAEPDEGKDDITTWHRKTGAIVITEAWAVDCISRYTLISIYSYLHELLPEEHLLALGYPAQLIEPDDQDSTGETSS